MPHDTLMALMLDPFLTYEEVVKQFGATSVSTHERAADSARTATRTRHPATVRRPSIRIQGSCGPVLHHPPATAG